MKTLFIMLLTAAAFLPAQITTKSADIFEEMDSGALTLRIYNAVNGQPVAGASVALPAVGEYITDDEGKILFPAPDEDGVLTALVTAEGYIASEVPVEIMAGTLFFNRISISPIMDIKRVRIVVDWDKKPLDLDAHLVKHGAGGYHISYRNMRTLADKSGMLDIDAMRGYGPETITVNEISASSTYDYYIHDFSNAKNSASSALSDSKATVKVYGEGKLLKVLTVPRKKEGTVWNVFSIERGHIREVGQVGGELAPGGAFISF